MDDLSREEISGEDIARVEERIEDLVQSIERCRKFSLAAKAAIALGAAWIALTVVGILPFVAAPVIGALASAIGGVVLLGSNATTWREAEASLRASEALRRELIAGMNLRTVDQEVRRLP
ncbi:MAG TPA: hypothetical protein VFA57_00715 [Pseudolabrys sp.]|nr:hypothetical protein [Pseudolabrys sp.]